MQQAKAYRNEMYVENVKSLAKSAKAIVSVIVACMYTVPSVLNCTLLLIFLFAHLNLHLSLFITYSPISYPYLYMCTLSLYQYMSLHYDDITHYLNLI